MRGVYLLVGAAVYLPIQLWLSYKIMSLVPATELMWFLWWVQIPVVVFLRIAQSILEAE